MKNSTLQSHWPHFKNSLTTWARGYSIWQCIPVSVERSIGQCWSGKWAPGTFRASTCCCDCFKCQPCQSYMELSSTLVKQWVSWGLGISVEQVRSWWKQLAKTCASRLAHSQRRCTFSQKYTFVASEDMGTAHLWDRESTFLSLFSLNSESKVIHGNITGIC